MQINWVTDKKGKILKAYITKTDSDIETLNCPIFTKKLSS